MKYLVLYLREYAKKHGNSTHYDTKRLVDSHGNETQILINENILFNEAADRIEILELRLKELEKIDNVLKMLGYEDEQ